MKFHGRNIDPLSFWSHYVEFPTNMDTNSEFSSLTYCPNPAHDNYRSPAFQVNLERPLVHCFSRCGIEGSWEHAVCVVEGLYDQFQVDLATSRQERLKRVHRAHRAARRVILRGSTSTRTLSTHTRTPVKKKQQKRLDYETYLPPVAIEYLTKRGITDLSISFWGIGWDPDAKRIVIPCVDEYDRLSFLIKRAVLPGQNPKYLYSEDSMKTNVLFGASKVTTKSDSIVLTEGSIDAIKLYQYGIPATGILGTGISHEQVLILSRLRPRRIYLMFDKDMAGIRNIEIAADKLRLYPLYVCRYPRGKSDPAELTRQEALRSVESAVPVALWRQKVKKLGLRNRPRDGKLARVRTATDTERV